MQLTKDLTRKKPKTAIIMDELRDFSDEYIENVVFWVFLRFSAFFLRFSAVLQ